MIKWMGWGVMIVWERVKGGYGTPAMWIVLKGGKDTIDGLGDRCVRGSVWDGLRDQLNDTTMAKRIDWGTGRHNDGCNDGVGAHGGRIQPTGDVDGFGGQ